jgi:hypothetical protein
MTWCVRWINPVKLPKGAPTHFHEGGGWAESQGSLAHIDEIGDSLGGQIRGEISNELQDAESFFRS